MPQPHRARTSWAARLVALTLLALATLAHGVGEREAPALAALAADGQIPPLDERLPSQPLVVATADGRYGGTLTMRFPSAGTWNEIGSVKGRITPIVTREDGSFEPFLARAFELSDDGRSITLHLREGLRWSDGEPHTSADWLFWYEHVVRNEALTPVVSPTFRPGGEVMLVEADGPYVVRFTFAIPNPNFLAQLAINGGGYYLPAHFMQRFHADFADEAELAELVREAGVDEWWQLFQQRQQLLGWNVARRDEATPTLSSHRVASRSTNLVTLERNPYFWIVDADGRQLPYVDRLRAELVPDAEVATTKAIAGDFDVFVGETGNLALYVQNADRGNFDVVNWRSVYNEYVLFPNQTHVDDTRRAMLQEPRFRQALSLAIDRDEINDVAFLGLATPAQAAPAPGNPFHDPTWTASFADYDPDTANALLDELGYAWDDNRQWRRMHDGSRLRLGIELSAGTAWSDAHVTTSELIVEYFRDIGIDATYQLRSPDLFVEINRSSDFDIRVYALVNQPMRWRWLLREWVPTQSVWSGWSTLWSEWYESDGAAGMTPPEHIMRLFDLHDTWNHDPDEATRDAALREILAFQAENVNLIGTVQEAPHPMLVNRDLRGVQADLPWFWDTGMFMLSDPWAWWLERD